MVTSVTTLMGIPIMYSHQAKGLSAFFCKIDSEINESIQESINLGTVNKRMKAASLSE